MFILKSDLFVLEMKLLDSLFMAASFNISFGSIGLYEPGPPFYEYTYNYTGSTFSSNLGTVDKNTEFLLFSFDFLHYFASLTLHCCIVLADC